MLFCGRDTHETLFKNKYLDTASTIDEQCRGVSAECRDLLKLMTVHKDAIRLDVEGCIAHPWFKKESDQLQNMLIINRQTMSMKVSS